MNERIINTMGGELYLYVKTIDNKQDETIIDFIIEKIISLVNIFNFFDENSELSKLNKLRKTKSNKELKFLLNESLKFYNMSQGLFNVFIGEDIRNRKKNIKSEKIVLKNFGFNFQSDNIILDNDNFSIDLGGIAKGYILDRALEMALEKYGTNILDILIDARGDIICFGRNNKIIDVENPFDNEIKFENINLKSGAVITSGHNKQYFQEGSHILGIESDILTITLISEKMKCYELDALGTYLIQLNSEEVLEKIEFEEYYDDIECLIILKNGKILKSSFWNVYH